MNIKPCVKKTVSAGGCERKVKKKKKKKKKNKEATEKLEGERERVETSSERICMDRLERERFEVFCLDFEVEFLGFSVSVSVVPPFVFAVTVLVSNVNWVCEMVLM